MKKFYLLTLGALCSWQFLLAQVEFSDDFESYAAGSFLAVSSDDWVTWSGTSGGADDVRVIDTDAAGGEKSIRFSSSAANGGPVDIVLPFGQKFENGLFTLSMNVKVSEGAGAYWNFQGEQAIGAVWSHNCYFLPNGDLQFTDGNNALTLATGFTADTWITVSYEIDLTNNLWQVFVDGECLGNFSNEINSLASLNLYPLLGHDYYIDDVSFTWEEEVATKSFDAVVSTEALSVGGFTGMTEEIRGTLRNLGTETITEATLEVQYADGPRSFVLEGLSLAQGESVDFTAPEAYELAEGVNDVQIEVIDLNAGMADESPCNSKTSGRMLGVTPVPGKSVIVEEGTGTWCGWCPRGAVFLDRLVEKYGDRFIGIAVHNGDPMVVPGYDGQLGFQGYPAATVMRKSADPGFAIQAHLELPFLQYMSEGMAAEFEVGAEWDADNDRLLHVSLLVTAHERLTRLNSIAMMMLEDGVTGTGSGYAQANYYAGGANGEMGGYENLPSVVPASQMVYDHVARAIPLGVNGTRDVFAEAMEPGDERVMTFQYEVPEEYNTKNMHIVFALLDVARDIDNGYQISIEDAIANGLLTSSRDLVETVSDLQIAPNPVQDQLVMSFQSQRAQDLQLEITDLQGRTVLSEKIGLETGPNQITQDVSDLPAGSFMVALRSDEGVSMKSFIKQ